VDGDHGAEPGGRPGPERAGGRGPADDGTSEPDRRERLRERSVDDVERPADHERCDGRPKQQRPG